jgi:hypothetical protein
MRNCSDPDRNGSGFELKSYALDSRWFRLMKYSPHRAGDESETFYGRFGPKKLAA